MLHSVPQRLSSSSEMLWQRFQDALSTVQGDWPESFVLHCQQRPELPALWAASSFVATSCIRKPGLFFDLIHSGDVDRRYGDNDLARAVDRRLAEVENEENLHARLRQIRMREMVRIAWRDLSGFAELEETMRDVSNLADVCIEQAMHFHSKWLFKRFGKPQDNQGNDVRMIVLGLGKLGGRELNFSSDIDLIFAYEKPGDTAPWDAARQKSLSNQEFFTRLGHTMINALHSITMDGFVFRTDMRLRPNGNSGPLVLSFPAIDRYYQIQGRSWERYALIKARVVAGNRQAGAQLIAKLIPFVYRKYLDFGVYDAIRELKRMIQQKLKEKGIEDDIKLGWGGIREIEFLVQSHQLIRGGREAVLQTPSLYRAFSVLVDLGIIESQDRDQLIKSYRFLRNSEHRLQMVSDRQTQRLPQANDDRLRLAWSMGFDQWESYLKALHGHRSVVQEKFEMILESNKDPVSKEIGRSAEPSALRSDWLDALSRHLPDEKQTTAGEEGGHGSVFKLLHQFAEGRLYQAFSNEDRERIDRLIPSAIKEAANHVDTERAISAFIGVLESIGRRSVYLSLLIENPLALKQLLHLCAASPWISQYIGQHPVILDELLNPITDASCRHRSELQFELTNHLLQFEDDEEEERLNALREFHHAHVLRIAAADVLELLEVEDVHFSLTQLAEILLQHAFDHAVTIVRNKQQIRGFGAGVIAYGKFASQELGYHSDLDIVLCFEQQDRQTTHKKSDAEYFYSLVARRLIRLLTTRTYAGRLYELDMRLRPNGQSGILVTSLAGFIDYQLKSAWTWEHQALVRARAVVGDAHFMEHFEKARSEILCLQRDPDQLKQDVIVMRQKMIDANCQSTDRVYDIKLDKGGIVDIEFLIQYWVLRDAHKMPQLVAPRTTTDSVRVLVQCGIISKSTGDTLMETYRTYLRRSLDLKLMDSPVVVDQQDLQSSREAIKSIWAETFG